MAEHIDKQVALRRWPPCDEPADAYQYIKNFPAADVVSRDAFNRILAENDDMREMLAQISKKRGDSMADVRPVVLCRDCIHSEPWYADKSRCFLWHESGIDVFNDGFCNYGEKRGGS